jgi:hypothetical protein
MRPSLPLALALAVGLAGAAAVMNAAAQGSGAAPSPVPGAADHRDVPAMAGTERDGSSDMMSGWRWASHLSPEDRAAFFNARIAAVHAGLALTPDQEKMWPAVESAVRDGAKAWRERRERNQAAGPPTDPIERLKRLADAATIRGENLRKIADAAGPLYSTLTSDQKRRLAILTHFGHRRMDDQYWREGHDQFRDGTNEWQDRWRNRWHDRMGQWPDRRGDWLGRYRHDGESHQGQNDEDDSSRL